MKQLRLSLPGFGTHIRGVRGMLNGTANYILSAMMTGSDYAEGLAEAQAKGYAEADPTDDVEGVDAVAKTLTLAAVAFGRALTREQAQQVLSEGKCIKQLNTLRLVSMEGVEVSRETANRSSAE